MGVEEERAKKYSVSLLYGRSANTTRTSTLVRTTNRITDVVDVSLKVYSVLRQNSEQVIWA